MNEIAQQQGIRKWRADDWLNMQSTYLRLIEDFYKQYGNFIYEGCIPANGTITAGIVMLDGKACPFAGAAGVTDALYVRLAREDESVEYEITGMQTGFINFFAEVCSASDEGAFRLDNAPRFRDVILSVGSVTEARLANNAVTADKIAVNAITTEKIADSNVTTGKIANGAVTAEKMANNAITGDKLDFPVIVAAGQVYSNGIYQPVKGARCTVTREGTGRYKITHNLNYINYYVIASVLYFSGIVYIQRYESSYFYVHTQNLAGQYDDLIEFYFCIIK